MGIWDLFNGKQVQSERTLSVKKSEHLDEKVRMLIDVFEDWMDEIYINPDEYHWLS